MTLIYICFLLGKKFFIYLYCIVFAAETAAESQPHSWKVFSTFGTQKGVKELLRGAINNYKQLAKVSAKNQGSSWRLCRSGEGKD